MAVRARRTPKSSTRKGAWEVVPTGRDSAEVIAPRARYTVTADRTSFTLRAYEGAKGVEKHSLRRAGHQYILRGTDRRGVTERLTLTVTRKKFSTRGVIGGRAFALESMCTVRCSSRRCEERNASRCRTCAPSPNAGARTTRFAGDSAVR